MDRIVSKGAPDSQALAIPINPLVQAALRSLYSGPGGLWGTGLYGSPLFSYEAKDGRIYIFYEMPPGIRAIDYGKIFMSPRLARPGFIIAQQLRKNVSGLSVETGDVFIILLSEIARLHNPGKDIAWISLEDIAGKRGVNLRNGRKSTLMEDLRKHVSYIADLRLSMTWKDYKRGNTMVFGGQNADRLLDIVDVEHRQGSRRWIEFGVRCGQALGYFLNRDSVRWIGYFHRSILQLSPYHDANTKKIGSYWTIIGSIAGKRGKLPRATPRRILQFCGSLVNQRNPGHTIDSFIKAHDRLMQCGALQAVSELEPATRTKGYFKTWLDTPISVQLSESLWQIQPGISVQNSGNIGTFPTPKSAENLCKYPFLIKDYRHKSGIHQQELARAVGLSRQTLSKYERGLQAIPPETAAKLFLIIQNKRNK
ncbi:MAG TPA: hypothetical protein DER60_11560 [Syntrophomonas sp.]|nr:hypothetical protein [Syntrophomonas sp.]